MAERQCKRPKLSTRDKDGYSPGNIVEIEAHNFMTYKYLKCKPSPRLNLLIGPNGSGKSSLVCAIALGLAGDPQLLGRAASVGSYVKRGEESGYIKISLRDNNLGENICIMRKIDKHNKSEWLVNGKAVSKRDVLDVIQRFNIQVNNLTQFLPQDRVCEFAKLTPIQLLEETEKAVGDPELPIQHNALTVKSRELKRLELTVKQNGDTMNQLKALNAEQEKDVERVRERDKLLEKVDLMKKKVPWLKYDMKKAEYMQAKENEKNAKKNLDEAAKVLKNLQAPVEERKQEKATHEQACKKLSDLMKNNSKKRMEILENENRLGVQVRAKYDEMEELRRQEETRQERISRAKDDLAAAELELANLPCFEPPRDEIESLSAQILELEISANQKRLHKTDKENLLAQKKASLRQCLDRLKAMENTNNKLLQALRSSGAEKIVEAYDWLQNHRDELRQEVYGPILLEVNVPNRVHAAYLENHVPYYIWKSFITQDAADRDFLVRNLRSFDIPVLNYVGDKSNKEMPFQVPEEMCKLGVYSRLDKVFDAPCAVKEVLTSQAALDRAYIGSSDADQKADEVSRLGILDLWTPENHYRWSVSRYGGHLSASVEPVHPSRLFMFSLDAGEVESRRLRKMELEENIVSLEESVKLLQTEQRHLEDEAAKLHRQREEIINDIQLQKRKRRDMESRVQQRKKKLESMEKEEDLETGTKKLIDEAAKGNKQRFQLAIKIKNLLIETVSSKWSFAEKHMRSAELDAKIRELEVGMKQQEKVALQASKLLEHCKTETEKCRGDLSNAKSYAESIAVITPNLAQAFLEMPSTIEELEAAIQDSTSEANSILFLNHNILEEYERRQQKIESIAMKLEADNKELGRCLSEIDILKEKWLPTLQNLVLKINETFSRNFQEMAVAGEVSLDEQDMDFDKYGILIRVKFRESGQLQVLSAHHQSGGERSVSTILFLISLQDITNCPFCVVDEINQGMDPINERKMFQQLVKAASQPNAPQCFLLTPKLLSNLEYGEACSVLDMYTGPWIKESSKAWSTGDSWRVVMGYEASV